jgi:hypothetical protein
MKNMTQLTKTQIEQIGYEHGLRDFKLQVFVEYVIERDFIADDYYIREWAKRFVDNLEFERSDTQGKAILSRLIVHLGKHQKKVC